MIGHFSSSRNSIANAQVCMLDSAHVHIYPFCEMSDNSTKSNYRGSTAWKAPKLATVDSIRQNAQRVFKISLRRALSLPFFALCGEHISDTGRRSTLNLQSEKRGARCDTTGRNFTLAKYYAFCVRNLKYSYLLLQQNLWHFVVYLT